MANLATGNTSTEVFFGSALVGETIPVDIETGAPVGGGTASDNGPTLSGILQAATEQAPQFVDLDLATQASGIFGAATGHWSIRGGGLATGFFQKTATNDDGIRNGPPSPSGPFAFDRGSNNSPSWACVFFPVEFGVYAFTSFSLPARGANVKISDLTLNGNRGNGTNGNSTSGDPRGLPLFGSPGPANDRFYCAIQLRDLNNIDISNVRFFNCASFLIRIGNVSNVFLRDLLLLSIPGNTDIPPVSSVAANGDGIHINGNSSDIHVVNVHGETSDDFTALNSCEDYPGPIERVTFTNLTAKNCQTFARLYYTGQLAGTAAQTGSITDVSYVNCVGSCNETGFLFGLEAAYTRYNLDRIDRITINATIESPVFACIFDNVGAILFANCIWTCVRVYTQVCGAIVLGFNGATAQSLTIRGFVIRRTAANNGALGLLDLTSPTAFGSPSTGAHLIHELIIDGHEVQDDSGSSFSAIPYVIRLNSASVISRLVINALNPQHYGALCDPALITQIQLVTGPGVLATGWQFPDSIMDNNTLYLSSNNGGALSMKTGGTRRTIVQS